MPGLGFGRPIVVAGAGQDKLTTNNLVQWSGVGINLSDRAPDIDGIRAGIDKVLTDRSYKERVTETSRALDESDFGTVFDDVIQDVVKGWEKQGG